MLLFSYSRYVCEDRTDETDNEDEIISKRNLSGDYDGDPKHPEGYIDNATEMSREEVNEMIKNSNPVTQLDNNTDGIHIDCYEYENNNRYNLPSFIYSEYMLPPLPIPP